MPQAPLLRFKVVLLGEGRVGKTSILLRFVKDEYSEKQVSTLQASYLDRRLTMGDRPVHLSIWDTAGQERFHALGPIYYRDADGALLVYDITDYESFAKVRKWVRELRQIVGSDILIVIAGNKVDLERDRVVPEEEALSYAQSVGASHVYTSAKQNKGLDQAFETLSRLMAKRRNTASSRPLAHSSNSASAHASSKRPSLVLVDDTNSQHQNTPKKTSCC